MLNDTTKKMFLAFLSSQGITAEFSFGLKPQYPSIDSYFAKYEHLQFEAGELISYAFDWRKAQGGYALWQYHNTTWKHCLQMDIMKKKQVKNGL